MFKSLINFMTKSTKTSLIIAILIFITNSTIFSQKIIFDSIQGDTSFCLTKTQSQFLIQRYYKAQELSRVNDIKDTIINLQDSTIKFLDQANSLLANTIQENKQAKDYLQQQVNIKDAQVTNVKKKNNWLKKIVTVTIPIVIAESIVIYLQNK